MSNIHFFYETAFQLEKEGNIRSWVLTTIEKETYIPGPLSFIFCDDEYLHKINLQYLNHDTYTDIITFDYSNKRSLSGDIFISIERVKENAKGQEIPFDAELKRVIIHGVLHLAGYKDKNPEEKRLMREKEDFYLSLHP